MGTCGFQQYLDPFRPSHLDTVENRKSTEQAIQTSADRKTGLVERQIQTLGNTGEQFRGRIIKCIRTSQEARIAHVRGMRVERTARYSNDNNELRWEFGIDLEPEVSEWTAGGRTDLGRQQGRRKPQRNQGVNLGGVAEAETALQARGTDLEDEEKKCYITSL